MKTPLPAIRQKIQCSAFSLMLALAVGGCSDGATGPADVSGGGAGEVYRVNVVEPGGAVSTGGSAATMQEMQASESPGASGGMGAVVGDTGAAGGQGSTVVLPPRPEGLGKFEPPDGQILQLIGQNTQPIKNYMSAVGMPMGVMTYNGLTYNEVFTTNEHDVSDGYKDFFPWINDHDNLAIQMGLYLVGMDAGILGGQYDANLTTLGNYLKNADAPIFLRIGYEVNLHHNMQTYPALFRYVVDHLDNMGVTNVAYVFHAHDTVGSDVGNWYPGDDYVDWIGVSMFSNVLSNPGKTHDLLGFGRFVGKPLMIAESTPEGIGTNDVNSWNTWFQAVVGFINEYDIKAFCYINQDWAANPDEGQSHWGDSRVQNNPQVLQIWNNEINQSRYLKQGVETMGLIGYLQ